MVHMSICAAKKATRRHATFGHLLLMTALSPLLVLLSFSHFIATLTGREPKWPSEMS